MSNRKRISNTFVVNTVEDGKSIATVLLSPNSVYFDADSWGYAINDNDRFKVNYEMRVGDESIPYNKITIENVTYDGDGRIYYNSKDFDGEGEDNYDSEIAWNNAKSGYLYFHIIKSRSPHVNGILLVTLSCTYNGVKYTATGECNVLPNKQGSAGKMFYYAGVWEDLRDNPNTELVVTSQQAPFVSYTPDKEKNPNVRLFAIFDAPPSNYKISFIVYNLEMVDERNLPDTSKDGTYWKLMNNNFTYLITKAIFGDFAKFGSAIISGDWMISQHGTIYDTTGASHIIDADETHSWNDAGNDITYTFDNAYTLFNPSFPNSNQSGEVNFIPNYAVDLKSGKTFQHDAYISGTVEATSGKIGSFRIEGNKIISTISSIFNSVEYEDYLKLYGNGIGFENNSGHFKVGQEISQQDGIVDIGFVNGSREGYNGFALRVSAYDYAFGSAAIDIVQGFVSGLRRYSYKVDNDANYDYLNLVCDNSTGMLAKAYDYSNLSVFNALCLSIRSGAFIVCSGFNTIVLPDSTRNGFVSDGMFFTFRLLTQTRFITHEYSGVQQDSINSSYSSNKIPANTTITFTYLNRVWYQS